MRIDNARSAALERAKEYARSRSAGEAQIDAVAEDFEAVFLSQMLQHMFKDVGKDSITSGGQSEEMYQSLLVDEYGKMMSRAGGIGVADYVKREMLKLQEVVQ